jgi:hypothetical protein
MLPECIFPNRWENEVGWKNSTVMLKRYINRFIFAMFFQKSQSYYLFK